MQRLLLGGGKFILWNIFIGKHIKGKTSHILDDETFAGVSTIMEGLIDELAAIKNKLIKGGVVCSSF